MRPYEFDRDDMPVERVYTDAPMEHMWSRFERIATPEGARNLILELTRIADCDAPQSLGDKARGLAFAVRSAREYFQPRAARNMTLAALSYYYGALWLLSALMMADPTQKDDLETIEGHMRHGHGLGKIDDDREGVLFPDDSVLFVKNNGLFTAYLRSIEAPMPEIVVQDRINSLGDLQGWPHWPLTDLLARVPELLSTWDEVMDEPPAYAAAARGFGNSYIIPRLSSRHFPDPDSRYALGGIEPPGSGILSEGYHLAYFNRDSEKFPQLPFHSTEWCQTAFVRPLQPGLDKAIVYHFMALYALSIHVRYQPNKWRDVLEGGKEYRRQLISEYLLTVERIVPNLFLDHLFLRRHVFAGHVRYG